MLTPTVVSHSTVRRTNRPPVANPRSSARCSSCAMRHLCMPQGLAVDDMPKLEALICTARSVRRGEALYRAGDPFDNLYAVRSGSLKTVMAHRDGREQVTGLRLAGDPLGLDGISTDTHTCTAVALEDSSVCIVPYARRGRGNHRKLRRPSEHRKKDATIARTTRPMQAHMRHRDAPHWPPRKGAS